MSGMRESVTFYRTREVQTKTGRYVPYQTWVARNGRGRVLAFHEDLEQLRRLFPNGRTESH